MWLWQERVRRSDETDADEEEHVEERPPSGEPRKRNTHMNEVVVRVVGNGADVCVWGGEEGENGKKEEGAWAGCQMDACARACGRWGKVVEERARRWREEGGDETTDE